MIRNIFLLLISIHSLRAQITCLAPVSTNPVGFFQRISSINKYIFFDSKVQSPFTFKYDEAKKTCEDHGLQMAEIHNEFDKWSLQNFISDPSFRFWLGLNDQKHEGKFVEGDGTPISFQLFAPGKPDDFFGFEDCVHFMRVGNKLYMDDVGCGTTAGILCQFRLGSYCDINSFQNSVKITFTLFSSGHGVYMSNKQRTRDDALRACLNAKKFLVSIPDESTNVAVQEEVQAYSRKYETVDVNTAFWTSGTFKKKKNGSYDGNIFWETIETKYDLARNPENIAFEWGPDEPNFYGAPSSDGCLDVTFPAPNLVSIPIWRSSNCLLPKYYMCVDVNITVSKESFQERFKALELSDNKRSNVKKDKKGSKCDAEITEINPPTLNFTDLISPQSLSIDDSLKLMYFVLENNIQSGNTKIKLEEKIQWKREFIELIFDIFKASVKAEFVPRGFLNVAQEINLLYQNAFGGEGESVSHDGWDVVETALLDCKKNSKPLNYSTEGLTVGFMSMGNSSDTEHHIEPPEELADKFNNLDIAMDVMWYLFSFSLGFCYPYSIMADPSNWASQYYILFYLDYLEKLEKKWVVDDDYGFIKQSLIFGDYDVSTAMTSIQSIAASAYMHNEIVDKLLARPILLDTLFGSTSKSHPYNFNYKTDP